MGRQTMSDQSLPSTIRQFFEDYARAFESIDGARIATFYHAPTVTMRGDGSIHCLQSREELQRFFQGVVDGYYRDGYRTSGLLSFDVQLIGGRSALATIDWQLLRADGTVLREWRQSYNVVYVDGRWQILVSTFHVG